jgi:hypothetical protein
MTLRSGDAFSNLTLLNGMTGRPSVSGMVGVRRRGSDSVEILIEETDLSDLAGDVGSVEVDGGTVRGEISSEYFREGATTELVDS